MVATVAASSRPTPRMIRLVLGGSDLRGLPVGAFSDHYVKLQLPPPGAPYAPPFDVEEVRAALPRELWPRTRTLTVRSWDGDREQLTIDVVDHGDTGFAGPWAAAARPGDRVQLLGPGGGYAPDPTADWHLMVGDASALPAIAASLARVPAGMRVHALLEVEGDDERVELDCDGDLRVAWLAPDDRTAGDAAEPLLEAVAALEFPPGRVHCFVHGEADMVRAVRRHLVVERGVPAADLSASGYWKRARSDEDWRAEKPEWKRLVDADAAATTTGSE